MLYKVTLEDWPPTTGKAQIGDWITRPRTGRLNPVNTPGTDTQRTGRHPIDALGGMRWLSCEAKETDGSPQEQVDYALTFLPIGDPPSGSDVVMVVSLPETTESVSRMCRSRDLPATAI